MLGHIEHVLYIICAIRKQVGFLASRALEMYDAV
jgi:hypothetical protein